jgi:hypothetical protein
LLSSVRGLALSFFGIAAAQSHQARGQDAAYLAEVRRQMGVRPAGRWQQI